MVRSDIADVEFGGAIPPSNEINYVFEDDEDPAASDKQAAQAHELGFLMGAEAMQEVEDVQAVMTAAWSHLDPETRVTQTAPRQL